MMAFGGLEIVSVGIILFSLFDRSGPNELVPVDVAVIIAPMAVMLVLQLRAEVPRAALVGPSS